MNKWYCFIKQSQTDLHLTSRAVAYALTENYLEYLYILPLTQPHTMPEITYIREKQAIQQHVWNVS
jgi:hypothetical protein